MAIIYGHFCHPCMMHASAKALRYDCSGIMFLSARRFLDAIRRESIIPEFAVTENTHLSIPTTHQYRGHVDGNYGNDGNESDDASKNIRFSH